MTSSERAGYKALRRTIGNARADRLAYVYRDRVQPTLESWTYAADARGRRSGERLEAIANRYQGERCFIIGNGPSLAGMDLSVLRGELTFGLNRGYLLFDRIGSPTTFLVAVNRYVVEQFGKEIVEAGSDTFIAWRSRKWLPRDADVTYIRRGRLFTFSRDVGRHGAWEGATVTFVALQLAFHMGFSEVVLVGVDHSFATPGPANKLVTSSSADPNHFDPTYFGPGVRWQLPDLAVSEAGYGLARDAYAAAGRRIIDATVGGKLNVFPKATFSELFDRPA